MANGAHSAVRWYRIDAPGMTLVDTGTIAHPDLDLSYPSIAANEAGTVVVACNGSGTNSFVSCYAVAGTTKGGTLAFGELTLLKAGLASYQAPDDTGISRWGDYSATTVDPADPSRFWTIQGYPLNESDWAMQITELITAVSLDIVATNGNVAISWTASAAGAQLQFWAVPLRKRRSEHVAQTPTISDGRAMVVLPASGAAGYFRLVQ